MATITDARVAEPESSARHTHFLFTEEHEHLRETIRRFVATELAPHAERWEQSTFPDWVFERMGELGFLGLSFPERYGGQGGDRVSELVLVEEVTGCDSGGVSSGVAVHATAAAAVYELGTEEQRQRYLVPAIAGDAIACLGVTEADAGSDVAAIRTRAVREGDEFVLSGSKTYITNGLRADFIVLLAKTEPEQGHRGLTLFLVDMDAPGVVRHRNLDKLGMHSSDTVPLSFDGVRVPVDAVLGDVGKGFHNTMALFERERLMSAAGYPAAVQRAFDRTLRYAKDRQAFGRPIGQLQVIRHKLAEMATKLETARQMTYTTAWRLEHGACSARELSMAKLYAARIAVEVADECIQIHGGAGYMREYGIERAWRDARLGRIVAGSDEILLEVIGRSYGL